MARTSRTAVRRRSAFVLIPLLLVAIMAPAAYTFRQFWHSSAASLSSTRSEELGVGYLGPLTELLGVLSSAQSAAVETGATPGPLLARQVAAVDAVDSSDGAQLGTREAWSELRTRILALGGHQVSGESAYTLYAQATTLTLALISEVGDSSDLILDPESDSSYLVDAVTLRVPPLLVDAGLAQDLTDLSGTASGGVCGGPTCTPEIFAARDRIANTAAALESGLQKAFDDTDSSALGPELLGGVDAVRAAVAAIAPGTQLIDLPASVPDRVTIAAQGAQLSQAALALDANAITALDVLLRTRAAALSQQRDRVVAVTIAGFVLAMFLLLALVPGRRRGSDLDDEQGMAPATGEDELRLLDARDLLASGEPARLDQTVSVRHVRRGGPGRDS